MATNKAASTKKKPTAAKKAAPAPSKKQTVTKVTTVKATDTVRAKKATANGSRLPENIINVVFVELLGVFALTLVALLTLSSMAPLYLGLTLAAIVLAVGVVSGGHLNPAVSFGLWTMRRLSFVQVLFYWLAQLLGAMAAVVVLNLLSGGNYGLQFTGFDNLTWSILLVELIGTAVFMFGYAAATERLNLSPLTRALGIGLSFMTGLLVASSLLSVVQSSVDQASITSVDQIPHELRVQSATLNPAIALAASESTDSQLQGMAAAADEKQVSRLSLEVILGTLIGAALGGNLYLLTNYRNRRA